MRQLSADLLRGQRVGVFGGSFNPPHPAHLRLTELARARLRLDRCWWLVSPGNPLKAPDSYAPLAARVAAARALTRGRAWLTVSDAEAELGTRYSVDTLGALTARFPATQFVWLMGADSFAGFDRWRDYLGLAALAPILVMSRPGYDLPALQGVAGRRLAGARLPLSALTGLASRPAPAWIFLPALHSTLSSTALRAAGVGISPVV